ncbi:MAG TPA: Uma2 family endonuclease [Pseudonocardiaceae bacterium]|nr:Uma2 family endonuclease [Pseudonocardiaceae bacterium]
MFTVAEFAEVDEPVGWFYELCDGAVVRAPWHTPEHQLARAELWEQIHSCLPVGVLAVPGAHLDLCLARPDGPGTVRRPDIVVIDIEAYRRANREWKALRADEVLLAVEVMSVASRHTDRVIKRAEYAAAGIERYWLVDLDAPVSLLPMRRVDDLGYVEDGEVTGDGAVDGPFAVRLKLAELVR